MFNPDGLELNNGDDITLTDTLKTDVDNFTSVDLIRSNIKVTDNENKELNTSLWRYMYETQHTGRDVYNILKFIVPDRTPVVIHYEYQLKTVNKNADLKIGNSISTEVFNKTVTETETIQKKFSSSVTADLTQAIFHKHDKDDGSINLSGVKFEIYEYIRWETDWNTIDKDIWSEKPVYTFTINNGRYDLPLASLIKEKKLKYDTFYALKEVQTAEGYILPDEPVLYFWILPTETYSTPNIDVFWHIAQRYEGYPIRGGSIITDMKALLSSRSLGSVQLF